MNTIRFVAVAVALVAMTACDGPSGDASGEDIYIEACARCHAADLSGGIGPPLGPDSNAAARSDEYLVRIITEGRGRMPSFRQTLSSEQIQRVVDHLRAVQAGT